jgi:hypothetical protein
MRQTTSYDIVTPGQLVSPTGGGGTGGHTDNTDNNATTCHISLTHSRRRKVTGLIMTGLPCNTFSRLWVFSCMAVIMFVIMYMVGLLDHDMHLVMFASDNQPGFGLYFDLSYQVSGRRRRKTTKRKEASQSPQSFGQLCERPVKLQRIGNFINTIFLIHQDMFAR